MEIVTKLSALAPREPAIVTIGQFDGVHVGHQALVRRTAELADARNARAVAVTFWPHPLRVLRPDDPVPLLTTYDQKLALLADMGALDTLVVVPVSTESVRDSADALLTRLQECYEIRALVESPDFAVGGNRAGDLVWARGVGERFGFTVEVVEVERDGARVSSRRIRELVVAGAVESATSLLGRTYTVEGTVARGDQRGRLLGFPTANLRLDPAQLIPANGVYAVRVGLEGERELTRPGVANIGVRPTFGADNARLVEVHLLDAARDLYDRPLRAGFVARLREERRFSGVDALKTQIAADAAQARTLLASSGSATGPDAQQRAVAP